MDCSPFEKINRYLRSLAVLGVCHVGEKVLSFNFIAVLIEIHKSPHDVAPLIQEKDYPALHL